jgi:hypothetical protein
MQRLLERLMALLGSVALDVELVLPNRAIARSVATVAGAGGWPSMKRIIQRPP